MEKLPHVVQIPPATIAEFCKRHHIRKLSLFGSVLNEHFHAESDIDVLVEFEPGYTPGFEFFAMQEELSQIYGRSVELHTPNFLSPIFRASVLAKAQAQYEQP